MALARVADPKRPGADRRQTRYAEVEAAAGRYAPAALEHYRSWQRRFARALMRTLPDYMPADSRRLILMRARPELTPEIEAVWPDLDRAIRDALRELRSRVEETSRWRWPDDLADEAMIAAGMIPGDPEWREVRAEVRAIVRTWTRGQAESLIRPEVLLGAFRRARAEARSPRDLEELLVREWGMRVYQAERLVRTAYTAGSGHATVAKLRATGYTHKRWVATHDDRVRGRRPQDQHDHLHMDGQTVPVDQPFRDPRSGELLMFPGDTRLGASLGEVANCRCTIIGVN